MSDGSDTQPPGRGTQRGTPQSRKTPAQGAIRLVAPRNDTRTFDDLRAMGLALLDKEPKMTQRELREKNGCRNDTAAIRTVWRNQQRGEAREA